jgi:hypothetical protein
MEMAMATAMEIAIAMEMAMTMEIAMAMTVAMMARGRIGSELLWESRSGYSGAISYFEELNSNQSRRLSTLKQSLAQERLRTIVRYHLPIISPPSLIVGLLKMLSDDQESCTSPNSQGSGQATSTSISPQPPSITAGDIATGQFAIDLLLDEVLLEIFACYVEESRRRDAWHTLACVCRRWRSIAFGSPRRLNLRIFCSERIPVRENLDFWPPFPIVLTVDYFRRLGEDNILATLEHHDRVCHIKIRDISTSLWEKALPLMLKPFPILTDLNLAYTDGILDLPVAPVVPELFLDGSATRLRKLNLTRIPFPRLPKLLLSAAHLVHIGLYEIPDSGYIAPRVMVTCLSTLTRLESLILESESPRLHHPKWEGRRTSSSTRSLLPSLTCFTFKGVSEHLEDILDRVDAPLLDRLSIMFFHQPIFDTPRLAQFISRVPKLKTCNEARLRIGGWQPSVTVLSNTTTNAFLLLEDWNIYSDFQLSTLVQFCTSSFPQALIPTLEDLVIDGSISRPPGQDGIDPSLWRELFQPFTAVKNLYLFPEIAPQIALVLQELVGESVLEPFPVLQNIFLNELQPFGFVPEGIEQFVATRQLISHPISVSRWELDIEVLPVTSSW